MNYNVSEDIVLLCKLLNISLLQFSQEININEKTLYRTLKGETLLSNQNCEKIYDYLYKKNIQINKIKEMLYQESKKNNCVLLFHGSKSEITGELSSFVSRKNNDFGQGFYVGESYEQSATFVENYADSSIYVVEFCLEKLHGLTYSVNQDWMLIIAYYRGRLENYKKSPLLINLIKQVETADYIIAPIADNRMFKIIDSFIDGEITDEQCKHCLAATNLGNQYVIKSEEAIKNTILLERLFLSIEERNVYKNRKLADNKLSDDKVKIAKINYRGKGKYIEEILNENN